MSILEKGKRNLSLCFGKAPILFGQRETDLLPTRRASL